jgi:hypothetical protein
MGAPHLTTLAFCVGWVNGSRVMQYFRLPDLGTYLVVLEGEDIISIFVPLRTHDAVPFFLVLEDSKKVQQDKHANRHAQ